MYPANIMKQYINFHRLYHPNKVDAELKPCAQYIQTITRYALDRGTEEEN